MNLADLIWLAAMVAFWLIFPKDKGKKKKNVAPLKVAKPFKKLNLAPKSYRESSKGEKIEPLSLSLSLEDLDKNIKKDEEALEDVEDFEEWEEEEEEEEKEEIEALTPATPPWVPITYTPKSEKLRTPTYRSYSPSSNTATFEEDNNYQLHKRKASIAKNLLKGSLQDKFLLKEIFSKPKGYENNL